MRIVTRFDGVIEGDLDVPDECDLARGDFNLDGVVGPGDLLVLIVLRSFSTASAPMCLLPLRLFSSPTIRLSCTSLSGMSRDSSSVPTVQVSVQFGQKSHCELDIARQSRSHGEKVSNNNSNALCCELEPGHAGVTAERIARWEQLAGTWHKMARFGTEYRARPIPLLRHWECRQRSKIGGTLIAFHERWPGCATPLTE